MGVMSRFTRAGYFVFAECSLKNGGSTYFFWELPKPDSYPTQWSGLSTTNGRFVANRNGRGISVRDGHSGRELTLAGDVHVTFSPDGTWLLVVGQPDVTLFRLSGADRLNDAVQLPTSLTTFSGPSTKVEFTPNGRLAVLGVNRQRNAMELRRCPVDGLMSGQFTPGLDVFANPFSDSVPLPWTSITGPTYGSAASGFRQMNLLLVGACPFEGGIAFS